MPQSADNAGSDRAPDALTFRSRHRLSHDREFQAVYDAKMRKARSGLMVFTRPNGLPHHRLGLAVGARTIARATARNRAKRLLRESFRIGQHTLARAPNREAGEDGFDVIVSVRTDRPFTLSACSALLHDLVRECAAEWARRGRRNAAGNEAPDAPGGGPVTKP